MSRAILVAVLLGLTATTANASITAVSSTSDDPSQLDVTAKLDITVKRPLKRRVFAMACTPNGLCVDRARGPVVRLVKGRNRLAVDLTVTAWEHYHELDRDHPWQSLNDGFRPALADTAWVWFGRDRDAVVARPVGASASREVLREGT